MDCIDGLRRIAERQPTHTQVTEGLHLLEPIPPDSPVEGRRVIAQRLHDQTTEQQDCDLMSSHDNTGQLIL
jgi:hypothetical protein